MLFKLGKEFSSVSFTRQSGVLNNKEIRSSPRLDFRKKEYAVNTLGPFLHSTRNPEVSSDAITVKHQERPEPGGRNEYVVSWKSILSEIPLPK